MGVLKYILGKADPGEAEDLLPLDVDDTIPLTSPYASAEAAIDRAVQELNATHSGANRRDGPFADRRLGLPDMRPSGSPERRQEVHQDRRMAASQTGFGKRNRPN